MKKKILIGLVIVIVAVLLVVGGAGFWFHNLMKRVNSDDPTVWKPEIQAFEQSDQQQMPDLGSILFIGSSSFAMWDNLETDMAPLSVINRGFGGSKIPDITHYADRIVIPYKPGLIVFYAGDNDMSAGMIKTPQEVLDAYNAFTKKIHLALPETWIYFVSIKPSGLRWEQWPEMQKANKLIEQFTLTDERLGYIDISKVMLDAEGSLRKDIFKWDKLHLNSEGYRLWTSVIKPIITQK